MNNGNGIPNGRERDAPLQELANVVIGESGEKTDSQGGLMVPANGNNNASIADAAIVIPMDPAAGVGKNTTQQQLAILALGQSETDGEIDTNGDSMVEANSGDNGSVPNAFHAVSMDLPAAIDINDAQQEPAKVNVVGSVTVAVIDPTIVNKLNASQRQPATVAVGQLETSAEIDPQDGLIDSALGNDIGSAAGIGISDANDSEDEQVGFILKCHLKHSNKKHFYIKVNAFFVNICFSGLWRWRLHG